MERSAGRVLALCAAAPRLRDGCPRRRRARAVPVPGPQIPRPGAPDGHGGAPRTRPGAASSRPPRCRLLLASALGVCRSPHPLRALPRKPFALSQPPAASRVGGKADGGVRPLRAVLDAGRRRPRHRALRGREAAPGARNRAHPRRDRRPARGERHRRSGASLRFRGHQRVRRRPRRLGRAEPAVPRP